MYLAVWSWWGGHDNGLAARDLRWDGHHERAAGQDGCAARHIQAHRACDTGLPLHEHAMSQLFCVQYNAWLALHS